MPLLDMWHAHKHNATAGCCIKTECTVSCHHKERSYASWPHNVYGVYDGLYHPFRVSHSQDAAKPFGFPDTLTAASYVLRRAYAQLLWDFEQVRRRLHIGRGCQRALAASGWPAPALSCCAGNSASCSQRRAGRPPSVRQVSVHVAPCSQVYFFRRTGLRLEPPIEATRVSALSGCKCTCRMCLEDLRNHTGVPCQCPGQPMPRC